MRTLRWESARKVEDAGGSLWRGGVIRDPATKETWARVSDESIVAGLTLAPANERLVVWSGSYAQIDQKASAGAALFENHPRTWGAPGWSVFLSGLDNLPGSAVVIRPHAAHVVSDIPSIARLMRERGDVGVLVDPECLIPAQVRERGDSGELLRRIFEGLSTLPRPVEGLVVVPSLDLERPPHASDLIEIGYSPA